MAPIHSGLACRVPPSASSSCFLSSHIEMKKKERERVWWMGGGREKRAKNGKGYNNRNLRSELCEWLKSALGGSFYRAMGGRKWREKWRKREGEQTERKKEKEEDRKENSEILIHFIPALASQRPLGACCGAVGFHWSPDSCQSFSPAPVELCQPQVCDCNLNSPRVTPTNRSHVTIWNMERNDGHGGEG